MFYRNGYIIARSKPAVNKDKVRQNKDKFIIKAITRAGYPYGYVTASEIILFPEEMIGKRIRLKVEVL